jgi:hypothetical protein
MVEMFRVYTEINDKELRLAIKIAPRILKYELADGMDRISKGFLKRFRASRLQGPPGIRGASRFGLFGRFTRASIVSPSIEGMGIEIFADSKIAKLHEEGGIVKDPSGGMLAVPLSARDEMFTVRGKLKKKYKSPRLIKGLRRVKLRGKYFLAKGLRKLLPMFVLKPVVRISERLEYYRTWDRLANYRITILNSSIDKALRKL